MSQSSTVSATLLAKRRRRRAWHYRVLVVAAVIGLGVIGWLAAARWIGGGDAAPAYATQPVGRGDVVVTVTATGTLSPVVQVEVGSQVTGRIAELRADYNSRVEAGEIIAIIDPKRAESAVAQARARLASARAELARTQAVAVNARVQHQRLAALAERGAVAVSEVDAALAATRSADAAVKAAEAAVASAGAALEEAQVDLQYTTIRSPIDGVVVSRNVDVGQTVSASLQAPVLFVIAEDLTEMEVHTSVAESDVGRLEPGMTAEFTVDAFPERTFTGQVKQVRFEAATISNVVTYDAVVAVANPDLALRPGMTANVSFIVEARRDVVVVPQRALAYRPPGSAERPGPSGATVWVLRDGAPSPVDVEVGLSDGSQVEVTGGALEPGDPVITGDSATRSTRPDQQQPGRRRGPMRIL